MLYFEELKGTFSPGAASYLGDDITILNSNDLSVEFMSSNSEIKTLKYGYDVEIEPNYRVGVSNPAYVTRSAPKVQLSMELYDYDYSMPVTGVRENFKINFKDKNQNSKVLFNINGRITDKSADFSVGSRTITSFNIIQSDLGVMDASLPSITSLHPESGKSGDVVAVNGNNFVNVRKVLLGQFPCSLSGDVEATSLNFVVPQGMSSGFKAPVHVITEGAEASSPTGYLVNTGILTYGY
jgi:hypothetical protein